MLSRIARSSSALHSLLLALISLAPISIPHLVFDAVALLGDQHRAAERTNHFAVLVEAGGLHADDASTVKGLQTMQRPNSDALAYSASKCIGCVFIVNNVNHVLSVSVMVRPGRCS